MDDLYQQLIIEEAKHPRNRGQLQPADAHHHETNASCGDEIDVYLQVSPDKQKLVEVKWQGAGCIISQAQMSLLSQKVKGMLLADILKLNRTDLLALFHLTAIAPGRERCLMISLTSIQQAVKKILARPPAPETINQ